MGIFLYNGGMSTFSPRGPKFYCISQGIFELVLNYILSSVTRRERIILSPKFTRTKTNQTYSSKVASASWNRWLTTLWSLSQLSNFENQFEKSMYVIDEAMMAKRRQPRGHCRISSYDDNVDYERHTGKSIEHRRRRNTALGIFRERKIIIWKIVRIRMENENSRCTARSPWKRLSGQKEPIARVGWKDDKLAAIQPFHMVL